MDIVNFLNNFKINLTGTANSRSDQAMWPFSLVAAEKHITSLMFFSEEIKIGPRRAPLSSLELGAALGVGRCRGGRIIEIFGPESSEKTTLTLRINAEAQRVGGPGSGRRSSNRPDRQKSPD